MRAQYQNYVLRKQCAYNQHENLMGWYQYEYDALYHEKQLWKAKWSTGKTLYGEFENLVNEEILPFF